MMISVLSFEFLIITENLTIMIFTITRFLTFNIGQIIAQVAVLQMNIEIRQVIDMKL